MAVIDDLAQLPLFSMVGHDGLVDLAKYAEEIDVPGGAELTHEGKYEGSVFVVLEGSFGIERDGRTVDTVGPGGFFGEIAASDGGPRAAAGRAPQDSRVIAVAPRRFNDGLDASPDLRSAGMDEMEARLARIDGGT